MTNKEAGMPQNLEILGQVLHDVLCTLRTMYVHYQNLHWESKGNSFYSDHLLFQRLYEGVAEETDALAEKILGLTGQTKWVSDLHTFQHGHDTLQIWYEVTKGDDSTSRAFFSEMYFQEQLDYARAVLEESNNMTYGLDDFLGGLASKHEEHVYLLRQRWGKVEHESRVASGAGHHFHDNPEKREVRQLQQSKAKGNAITDKPSDAPPTPSDILEDKGKEFSTLSRYVINTAQPTKKPMPSSRAELPKQAKRVRLTRSK